MLFCGAYLTVTSMLFYILYTSSILELYCKIRVIGPIILDTVQGQKTFCNFVLNIYSCSNSFNVRFRFLLPLESVPYDSETVYVFVVFVLILFVGILTVTVIVLINRADNILRVLHVFYTTYKYSSNIL